MSASVDLLPPQIVEQRQRRRHLQALGGLVALLLVGLALVQVGELRSAARAEERRDLAEAELATLRAEAAALDEFARIADELETSQLRLVDALGTEVGFAGVLQDLAAVLPTDASFGDLTLAAGEDAMVAQLTLSGETRRGVAPGVERLMIALDKVDAFERTVLASTSVDGEYTSFDVLVEVGAAALTGRYHDGLPEELR